MPPPQYLVPVRFGLFGLFRFRLLLFKKRRKLSLFPCQMQARKYGIIARRDIIVPAIAEIYDSGDVIPFRIQNVIGFDCCFSEHRSSPSPELTESSPQPPHLPTRPVPRNRPPP